jgi:hypothetical protein
MSPLRLQSYQNNSFEGPSHFTFDFKECCFDPIFHTYDNFQNSISVVLEALKLSGHLTRGAYKGYDNHYGPVTIENIQVEDFVEIEGKKLLTTLNQLIDGTSSKFYNLTYENRALDIVKRKVHTVLECMPLDGVSFFKYNVEIGKTNIGSIKVVEHNLFDYFYFFIGFNNARFYLLTLFSE